MIMAHIRYRFYNKNKNGVVALSCDILQEGKHSQKTKELVAELITRLEDIPVGGAGCFPFEMIDMLKNEFFTEICR